MHDLTSVPRRAKAAVGSAARSLSRAAFATATLGAAYPALLATSTQIEAKTPGKSYCFYGKCHRVRTLEETQKLVGVRVTLKASHYDDPGKDRYNPSNLTSSGEWFKAGVPDNAASPTLPNGTVLFAYNPSTRQAAVLRINNAGPYWGDRTLDVSRAAAERLGFAKQGVATLITQVVRAPTRQDVTYKKGRRYDEVPGYIGSHATFELALADASRRMNSSPLPLPLAPSPGSLGTIVATTDLGVQGVDPAPQPASPAPIALATLAPGAFAIGRATETAAAPAVVAALPDDTLAVLPKLSAMPAVGPAVAQAAKIAKSRPAKARATRLATRSTKPALVKTAQVASPKSKSKSVQVAALTRTPAKVARSERVERMALRPITAPQRRIARATVLAGYEALPRPSRNETLRRSVQSRRAAADYDEFDD